MSDPLSLPVFDGPSLSLRAVEPDDWPVFADHERDFSSTRLGAGWVPVPWSRARLQTWAAAPERSVVNDDAFLWAVTRRDDDGRVVGTINTHHCDRRVGVFSYGVTTFPDDRRTGVATEAVALVLGWMFGELRYRKCDVTIYEYNDASLAFHRRFGFVDEGRRRRAVFTAGRHFDEHLLGITDEEFRARP